MKTPTIRDRARAFGRRHALLERRFLAAAWLFAWNNIEELEDSHLIAANQLVDAYDALREHGELKPSEAKR